MTFSKTKPRPKPGPVTDHFGATSVASALSIRAGAIPLGPIHFNRLFPTELFKEDISTWQESGRFYSALTAKTLIAKTLIAKTLIEVLRGVILARTWITIKETYVGEHPTPEHILQIGLGFWASKVLLSAVEMSLFTELAQNAAGLETLQGRLGLHPRAARDFLDSLVALGFLERHDGIYRNTPATDMFLDQRKPSYIGGVLEMANHRLYGFWGHLTEAVRTGNPQNEVRTGAASMFETLYADPARLRQFLAAMSGISRGAGLAIAAKFPWNSYGTFVDVGTAQGDTAAQIASAHPHLRGTGFDLAEVGPIFEEYVETLRLSDRLRFKAGSFFDAPLPKADVVIMGHRSQNAFGLMASLNMLIETPGGFDSTGADCEGWMREAGFRETRVEHLAGPDSMVIGIK